MSKRDLFKYSIDLCKVIKKDNNPENSIFMKMLVKSLNAIYYYKIKNKNTSGITRQRKINNLNLY